MYMIHVKNIFIMPTHFFSVLFPMKDLNLGKINNHDNIVFNLKCTKCNQYMYYSV